MKTITLILVVLTLTACGKGPKDQPQYQCYTKRELINQCVYYRSIDLVKANPDIQQDIIEFYNVECNEIYSGLETLDSIGCFKPEAYNLIDKRERQ